MALIPLKQTVTITPPGVTDEWGNSVAGAPYTLKARVDEYVKEVVNAAGDEVLAGFEITFNKIPDITYDHTIEYTDELGVTIKRKPIRIERVRMPNGKATLTAVYC